MKTVSLVSFSVLEVFERVSWCFSLLSFLCSFRFVGFISYRTSKIKLSKSATISSFIPISQELINKQLKDLSIFFTVVEIQRILVSIEIISSSSI